MTDEIKNRVPAQWTDDCQGKKDYDGDLVSLSTRYWPRGGSYVIFKDGRFESDGNDPQRQRFIPPSAKSAVVLRVAGERGVTLVEQEFVAETEGEVRTQVEAWAQSQYERIVCALSREFH